MFEGEVADSILLVVADTHLEEVAFHIVIDLEPYMDFLQVACILAITFDFV